MWAEVMSRKSRTVFTISRSRLVSAKSTSLGARLSPGRRFGCGARDAVGDDPGGVVAGSLMKVLGECVVSDCGFEERVLALFYEPIYFGRWKGILLFKQCLHIPGEITRRRMVVLDERNEHGLGFLFVDFDEAVARELLFERGCKLGELFVEREVLDAGKLLERDWQQGRNIGLRIRFIGGITIRPAAAEDGGITGIGCKTDGRAAGKPIVGLEELPGCLAAERCMRPLIAAAGEPPRAGGVRIDRIARIRGPELGLIDGDLDSLGIELVNEQLLGHVACPLYRQPAEHRLDLAVRQRINEVIGELTEALVRKDRVETELAHLIEHLDRKS